MRASAVQGAQKRKQAVRAFTPTAFPIARAGGRPQARAQAGCGRARSEHGPEPDVWGRQDARSPKGEHGTVRGNPREAEGA